MYFRAYKVSVVINFPYFHILYCKKSNVEYENKKSSFVCSNSLYKAINLVILSLGWGFLGLRSFIINMTLLLFSIQTHRIASYGQFTVLHVCNPTKSIWCEKHKKTHTKHIAIDFIFTYMIGSMWWWYCLIWTWKALFCIVTDSMLLSILGLWKRLYTLHSFYWPAPADAVL